MRCARKPTSVKQPKWHSLSTSSTACWRWDARATSASYETTRTRDHCVHRLIHATRSRGATIYDPWHYVPVLARKPGALRHGAPFKDRLLPASLERLRRKLKGFD